MMMRAIRNFFLKRSGETETPPKTTEIMFIKGIIHFRKNSKDRNPKRHQSFLSLQYNQERKHRIAHKWRGCAGASNNFFYFSLFKLTEANQLIVLFEAKHTDEPSVPRSLLRFCTLIEYSIKTTIYLIPHNHPWACICVKTGLRLLQLRRQVYYQLLRSAETINGFTLRKRNHYRFLSMEARRLRRLQPADRSWLNPYYIILKLIKTMDWS